jgi:hypothetical protein
LDVDPSTAWPSQGAGKRKAKLMNWEDPSFSEIKMDAEISSFQDDFYPTRDLILWGGADRASDGDVIRAADEWG